MSRIQIGETVEAGNAVDVSVFTMPAGYAGIIGSIIGTNTTVGALNLTLKLTRKGVTYTILPATSIAASDVGYFNRGAAKPITPLVLNAGDIIKAQGSGAGVNVTISGLRFST